MSDFTVLGFYILISFVGVLFSCFIYTRYSGFHFRWKFFWVSFLIGGFFMVSHISVIKDGYNTLIPITEPWLKGNVFVGWAAFVFLFLQSFLLPTKNEPSIRKCLSIFSRKNSYLG
ncbi:hypothetical protein [Aeromonas cavernicola]|uniref:Uncharacterized protein n=1 Tax=Aeromonas cavernicola TaxID=1006623 RepID=A0A2H9U1V0_9GAMM|nr:hypothetical protein [Aeromonas cavernicola]PJG57993.1 hypothetical protein CUC53_14975 [Aeromonas cavernicola]